MRVVHEVYTCELKETVDLDVWITKLSNAQRRRVPFNCILWREYNATTFIFQNGKLICHGSKESLGKCCSVLGFDDVPVKLVTSSAVHDFGLPIIYSDLIEFFQSDDVTYEPELFHAVTVKKDDVTFNFFATGKLVITGLKCEENIETALSVILDVTMMIEK